MDPALIAAGGIAVFAAGWLGAVAHHTLVSPKGEGSPNVCGDALTIERLTQERDDALNRSARSSARFAVACHDVAVARLALARAEAENRDLHTDIAEKAKRLSDAGLQSAGGCDA